MIRRRLQQGPITVSLWQLAMFCITFNVLTSTRFSNCIATYLVIELGFTKVLSGGALTMNGV